MKRLRIASARLALGAAFSLLAAFSGSAQDPNLSSEQRNEIRKSVVYIQTSNDDSGGSGSGFVVKVDGDACYIITNNHVIDVDKAGVDLDERRTRLKVIFDSSSRNSEPIPAELLASDKVHDLALLKVTKPDAPAPISLESKRMVEETLPVTMFGYPLGDREITINTGQVSGFKKNDVGSLVSVKTFIKADPGNSGGPIVNADGDLVGVLTAGDMRAENVTYAGPAFEVRNLMRGVLGNVVFKQEGDGETYKLTMEADVLDPFENLKSATAMVAFKKDLPEDVLEKSVSDLGRQWKALSDAMETHPIEIQGKTVSLDIPVKGSHGDELWMQIDYKRGEGGDSVSEPYPVILGGTLAANEKGRRIPLPEETEINIGGERIGLPGYRASTWNLDAAKLIPNLFWDQDGLLMYAASTDGIVRKIDPFRTQQDAILELGFPCKWIEMSGEGILVQPAEVAELWILDRRSLHVRRVVEAEGLESFAASPMNFYAFCTTEGGKKLQVYDLVDGEVTQTYEVSAMETPAGSADRAVKLESFSMLKMTPDGRYLLCASGGGLHRFEVQDDVLTYAAAGPPLADEPQALVVSHDGQYVSLTDSLGNKEVGAVPISPGGIYVLPVEDFTDPLLALDPGQAMPLVVRGHSGTQYFGTLKNSPLVLFSRTGEKEREFPELEGEFARQILPYPTRSGYLVVLTDKQLYVLKG